MDPRLQRLRELFLAARELTGENRIRFLQLFCDASEREELERMLAEDTEESGVFVREIGTPASRDARLIEQPHIFHRGQLIAGRYRMLRFLGRGGMGEVYEVEDQTLHCRVALKTARREQINAHGASRLLQELQLARKISHPNVCRVFDIASHGDEPSDSLLLTMELIEGETLAERIKREGPIPPGQALTLARQMAAALDAAHAAGVIHRDFKSSNVMLTRDDRGLERAVVTDFGLALGSQPAGDAAPTMTGTGKILGTLDYMAPEQVLGADATPLSDNYSFGMVLYEMIAGMRPFAGLNPVGAVYRRLQDQIPSPLLLVPGLGKQWERAILGCLKRDANARFLHASDAIRILDGEKIGGHREKPAPDKRRGARDDRVQWLAAAAGALAVSALLAAAAFGWLNGPPPDVSSNSEANIAYRRGLEFMNSGIYSPAARMFSHAVQVDPHFRLAHAHLADALIGMDDLARAEDEILIATNDEESGSLSADGRLFVNGIYSIVIADYSRAEQAFRKLLERTPFDQREMRQMDLARTFMRASEYKEAIEELRSVTIANRLHGGAWLFQGLVFGILGEAEKSAAAFDAADSVFSSEGSAEGLTALYSARASIQDREGRPNAAREWVAKALNQVEISGNQQQRANCLLLSSSINADSGFYEQAVNDAEDAREIAQREHFGVQTGMALMRLAEAYSMFGRRAEQENYLKQAIDVANRNRDRRLESSARNELAGFYDATSRPREALRQAQAAYEFFSEKKMSAESNRCLLVIGRAYRSLGDWENARRIANKLLQPELCRSDEDRAYADEFSGSLMTILENYALALVHLRRMPTLLTADDPYAALNRARALWRLGKFDDADAEFAAAERLGAKIRPILYNSAIERAQALLARQRFADARKYASRARSYSDNGVTGELALVEANLLLSVDPAEAARTLETLWNSSDEMFRTSLRLPLAAALLASGNFEGAITTVTGLGTNWDQLPESKARGLTLAAIAAEKAGDFGSSSRFAARARDAWHALRMAWGDENWRAYSTRPDIKALLQSRALTESAALKAPETE
jgi:serine/threonine protein kinase